MTDTSRATAGRSAMPSPAGCRVTELGFAALRGWAQDDHEAALTAFLVTCGAMPLPEWAGLDALAREVSPGGAKAFFEFRFRPVLIEDGGSGLFTGYYEPELDGDLVPSDRFSVPLYRTPPDLRLPGPTRAEIEDGALEGQGLEIAWVEDPMEAFLLQVQGSGRIRLPWGGVLRIGYAGGNGHPYRSIGAELVRQGEIGAGAISIDAIQAWVAAHPTEGAALRRINPSYSFFREIDEVPPEQGPLGAMGRPVTAGRSVAVDPDRVPLGLPVWLETEGDGVSRLFVAQDTGSAIKGAQRADIFFGTGAEAGRRAGRMHDRGRMVVLLPRLGESGDDLP